MNYQKLPESIVVEGQIKDREIGIDNKLLLPDRSLQLVKHSPDGFMWGYGGSGPAQLALAILLEFMPDQDALRLYQRFKAATVAVWPQADFIEVVPFRQIIEKLDTAVLS